MSKKEIIKRYILFIISLFFIGLGVAFTKHGELGISPISSVANILSYKFTFMTFGSWLIFSNCILIAGQIILLRKKFQLFQLFQLPLSFVFGYFTDFGMWCVSHIPNDVYGMKLLLVFIGIIILAFGISLGVIANVILNSGEAFVKTLAQVLKKEFSYVKIAFDVSWVAISIILSLIFFGGKLVGTREGTVISAVCTGIVVKFWNRLLKTPLEKILEKN